MRSGPSYTLQVRSAAYREAIGLAATIAHYGAETKNSKSRQLILLRLPCQLRVLRRNSEEATVG